MKEDKKFNEFYNKLVAEESDFLEKKRKEAGYESTRNKFLTVTLVIIGVILFFCLSRNVINLFRFYIVIILYIIIAVFIKRRFSFYNKKEEYTAEFNERVMRRMLVLFDKEAFYHRNDSISKDTYDDAEFEKYDRYFSNYSVSGRIKNKYDYVFGDVKTEYLERSDRHHRYVNLFSGLFMSVDCPNKFEDPIYIKNMDNILFRKLGYYKVPSKKLKIKFDLPEFDKEFDVYSAGNNMALKILNSDILKLFTDFRKEMNVRFEITFKNNHIYYRFFCGKLFKRKRFSNNLLDKRILYRYYRVISFSLLLSEKLVELVK